MISKKRAQEHTNLATDVIRYVKKKLWICRIALAISLAGNALLAAVLIFR